MTWDISHPLAFVSGFLFGLGGIGALILWADKRRARGGWVHHREERRP